MEGKRYLIQRSGNDFIIFDTFIGLVIAYCDSMDEAIDWCERNAR